MSETEPKHPDWLPAFLQPFYDAELVNLLCAAAIGEAEGEHYDGQFAVLCVLRNRAAKPGWWGTDLRSCTLHKHQLSCFWSDYAKRAQKMIMALEYPDTFPTAMKAAQDVLAGTEDITLGATSYFNAAVVVPSWAALMEHTVDIGRHSFFK